MQRTLRSLAVIAAAAAMLLAPPARLRATPLAALLADKKEEDKKEEELLKGERKELGSKDVNGYTIKVTQLGNVKPGEESLFLLNLTAGAGKPKVMRAWVGIESAEGSTKGKCEDEEKEWHAHVEVPKPIPDKSQFWLEVETDAGKKKISFDYKK